ncbi:MAG: GDSL-type esterase/lipase family protein [Syntrophobacteraceae bacterium]|nr:GDSL-type esterase/lipase family protein [Syntrophobacteraceae bacterium]
MNGYWHLDELSGSSYSDVLGANGASCAPDQNCPSGVMGKINNAQEFDRTQGTGVNIPGSDFNWSEDASFSIELWMNKSTDSVCAGSTTDSNEVIVGRDSPTDSLHWWVGINCNVAKGPQGVLVFTLKDKDGTGETERIYGKTSVVDGRWHHVVAVRDGSQNKLYLDGKPEGAISVDYAKSFDAGSTPVNVGWLNHQPNFGSFYRYTGVLDELAIHNRPMTSAEVRAHYFVVRSYCDTCASGLPVKIMPLGDSITKGSSSGVIEPELMVSYRKKLWEDLTAGLYNVELVGTLVNGEGHGNDSYALHEGHSGFTADQLAAVLPTSLQLTEPEVVLLHVGTNDIFFELGKPGGTERTVADIEALLDAIDQYSEDVTVILARIINRRCKIDSPPCQESEDTTALNGAIEALYDNRLAMGDKIFLVDQEAALDYHLQEDGGDLWDEKHPYQSGYEKMATVWLEKLDDFLPTCMPALPSITSSPVLKSYVGRNYHYDVEAAGNPTPQFILKQSPQGMTVSPYTGMITWIPTVQQMGSSVVTVEAFNDSGFDTQEFTVQVTDAPPCPDGMLSYWELNEKGGDEFADSFNGTPATCAEDCPTPTEEGVVEGAQGFGSGATGINVVPADASFNWPTNGSFSIEYWIKKDSPCTGNQVAVGRDDASTDLHWWAGCRELNGIHVAAFVLNASDGSGHGSQYNLAGKTDISDGVWHHVVAVRDGSAKKNILYVDGIEEASVSVTYTADFGSGNALINIGWLNLGGGYRLNGILDELALHGKALTSEEIASHFVAGSIHGEGYCNESLAPSIVKEPTPRSVVAGQSATFQVIAGGSLPLSYQWQKGTTNIPGATGASYTIAAAGAADDGAEYRCRVSNDADTVFSGSATLTVITPVSITTHPSNQKVVQGASATFSVVAEGTAPQYQWQKGTTDIPGATGASYTIAAAGAADDGAEYRCRVSNDAGWVLSSSATLTVEAGDIQISAHPKDVAVVAGYSARFVAKAMGPKGTRLRHQWQKNGQDIQGATRSSLMVPSAPIQDDGSRYRCRITGLAGFMYTNEATLTVHPIMITTQPLDAVIKEGGAARFSLRARGPRGARLAYQWLVGDGLSWTPVSPNGTRASLTVSQAPAGLRYYKCQLVASNGIGPVESRVVTLMVSP